MLSRLNQVMNSIHRWRISSYKFDFCEFYSAVSQSFAAKLIIIQLIFQPCPNGCSSHGRCTAPTTVCTCFDGFVGADCSLRICPYDLAWVDTASGVDKAHQSAECSNMGLCDRSTGQCECRAGFEGIACERQSCPSRCNGYGECQSMYYYAKTADPGAGAVYAYTSIWDAYKIYGCHCDTNYYGIDCSLRYCPNGDDPLTGTVQISSSNPQQHNEIQRVSCRADGGTFLLSFRSIPTIPIAYNAKVAAITTTLELLPNIGSGNVKVVMAGPQACTDYGTSFTVEFTQNFGDLPLLVPNSQFLSYASSLSSVSLSVAVVVEGTKEDAQCSNRGICDTDTGICSCSLDFSTSNGYNAPGTRGNCGYASDLVQFCPGVVACSAHGACAGSPTYTCSCADEWTGADCSERVCPSGLSWFGLPTADNTAHLSSYAECSQAGLCNRATGQCSCREGFTGAACNRLTCPGGFSGDSSSSSESSLCNGHGQCLDLASLAQLATINGDLTNYTYGTIPNNPSTWDADRIFGCYCDEGYSGYDCSLVDCPLGPDPQVTGSNEQQLIACTDATPASGSIVLTFREQSTAAIPASATIDEVQAALQALSAVGLVEVSIYQENANNTLCDAAGNSFLINFLTVHGHLPLMTATTQNVDALTITEYQAGTKKDIVCSGRGLCDYTTGLCDCFPGYGSSNGQGGAGTYRDCGYQLPIQILLDNA